jgi:hypothetical protein
VLADPQTRLLHRRLIRKTVLERRSEGSKTPQLAGANVDTLFIVTSCNADFNSARLERYLALANEAGTNPVILLTKADTVVDAQTYLTQASALQRGLAVLILNPRSRDSAATLAPWVRCGADSGAGRFLRSWQVDAGEHIGRPDTGVGPTNRRHSSTRCQRTSHYNLALAPCHCRWRIGD